MPFVITPTAAALASAAFLSSPSPPQPSTHETRCFYVPVRHVYIFDVYDTVQVECHQVPVKVK